MSSPNHADCLLIEMRENKGGRGSDISFPEKALYPPQPHYLLVMPTGIPHEYHRQGSRRCLVGLNERYITCLPIKKRNVLSRKFTQIVSVFDLAEEVGKSCKQETFWVSFVPELFHHSHPHTKCEQVQESEPIGPSKSLCNQCYTIRAPCQIKDVAVGHDVVTVGRGITQRIPLPKFRDTD